MRVITANIGRTPEVAGPRAAAERFTIRPKSHARRIPHGIRKAVRPMLAHYLGGIAGDSIRRFNTYMKKVAYDELTAQSFVNSSLRCQDR